MSRLLSLLAVIVAVTRCLAFIDREICLDELGCFGNLGAFYHVLWRPVALLPSGDPSVFRLYTRQNRISPQVMDPVKKNASSIEDGNFDPKLETKVIVHGFRESEGDWMIELKDAFLAREAVNVITVDWGQGSGIPYVQAATNTRVVGAQLAQLLQRLQNDSGLDLEKVQMIGFSLGAHICGYAGERLDGGVRRITALDPAGPMFEDLDPVVRLDPSDARFVDAIHTDGRSLLQLAFGMFSPVGHVDFYPNGGFKQPGCPENLVESISYATLGALLRGLDQAGEEVGCRHSRARDLFLESLRPEEQDCQFLAYPCSDWDSFQVGLCSSCGSNGTGSSVMGIQAENFLPSSPPPQEGWKLFLHTYPNRPFCRFHYSVTVKLEGAGDEGGFLSKLPTGPINVRSPYGQLDISLAGSNGASAHGTLGLGQQVFEAGGEYRYLFVSEHDLGELESLVIKWSPASVPSRLIRLNVWAENELPITSVVVRPMNLAADQGQQSYTFCSDGRATSEKRLELTKRTDSC